MTDTKRKILIIVVLLLVILFGVGQFFAGSNLNATNTTSTTGGGTTTTPPTQVFSYEPPLTPASSTPIEKGSCFAGSVAAPYRSDAYRCMVGNAISDPCFVVATSNNPTVFPYLVCGANPANPDVSSTFTLQLTKGLPRAEVPSSTPSNWAWLVELGDGTLCSPFTGTRPFDAAGDVATYSCAGSNTAEEMLFNGLNNTGATWTAEVGTLSTETSTFPPVMIASATVPVYAVWQ
jgi:hypothetical protein